MRILQVIPALAERYGGPSETVLSLAGELIRRGHDCLTVTTDADGARRLPVRHHEVTRWRGVPVQFFPKTMSESFKYSRALSRWLRWHVADFDVVHIHGIFSHASLAAAWACRARAVPYVLRPLGTLDPHTMGEKWLRKAIFWRLFGREMARSAAGIHYSTAREQRVVEQSLGVDRGFVSSIGIAPPTGHGSTPPSTQRSAAHSGLPKPYVLVMARLDPIKRIELLIDAFLRAGESPKLADWRLVVAGDGPSRYASALRRHARRAGEPGRVEFVGWVSGERKRILLESAELFALTSRHESFGRAVAEALACGVPALVTRDVYLADTIAQHDAGWIVGDSEPEIARTLQAAMSDGAARRVKGDRAARLSRSVLALTTSVGELLAHYERIRAGGFVASRATNGSASNEPTSVAGFEPPT